MGKVKKAWIQEGINLYLKRLPGLTISEIRDSNPEKEAENILSIIKKEELIVVLSEESNLFSSITFSHKLSQLANQRLVFVVGGSDGISSKIKNIADWNLSLSSFTFPHEIARLLLVEQIYRAYSIITNSPYHRS